MRKKLRYSLESITKNSWTKWSDLNSTLFGVPATSGNITAVIWATDNAGLYCKTEVKITVSKGGGWWPERLSIVLAVLVFLVIVAAVVHCFFIQKTAQVWEKVSTNVKLEQIQHKINMKRYKKEHGVKTDTKDQGKKQDWDKINVDVDRDLAARQPFSKRP